MLDSQLRAADHVRTSGHHLAKCSAVHGVVSSSDWGVEM